MNTPLLIKIRVAVVLAIGIVIFSTVGWSFARPWDPVGDLTVLSHHQPLQMAFMVLLVALISTAVAVAVSGRWAREIAPLAVPAGLSAFSVLTGGIFALLLKHNQLSGRSSMFYHFAGESVFWFVLVIAGFILAYLSFAFFRLGPAVKNSPAPLPEVKPAFIKRFIANFNSREMGTAVSALIGTCIIAAILLTLLVQSQSVKVTLLDQRVVLAACVPDPGQNIFAVFTAFLLATMLFQHLLNAPLWPFIPAPLIVAVFAYASAAHHAVQGPLAQVAPTFILPSIRIATVLPVQYIGLGTLAVIAGYWFSMRARRIRLHTT
jgi:hypothetical protein